MLTEAQLNTAVADCASRWLAKTRHNKEVREAHTSVWNGFTIRPAVYADVDRLVEVSRECYYFHKTPQALRKFVRQNIDVIENQGGGIYVVSIDNEVVGTGSLMPTMLPVEHQLSSIVGQLEAQNGRLTPEHHAKGIGAYVGMMILRHHFAKNPHGKPFCVIEMGNSASFKLAHMAGFETVGHARMKRPYTEDTVDVTFSQGDRTSFEKAQKKYGLS